MDAVPSLFIDAVLRTFGYSELRHMGELSDAWGQLAEVSLERSGYLHLFYKREPSTQWNRSNGWSLYYELCGWEHVESRTLCPEVAQQISKDIRAIRFFVDQNCSRGANWNRVSPDDKDDVWRLLLRLDAPERSLNLCMKEDHYKKLEKDLEEMVWRYSDLLRLFTSVKFGSFNQPVFVQLLEDLVSSGRLQDIDVRNIEYPLMPTIELTSSWAECFLSESCRSLVGVFQDTGFVLGLINRWMWMDSWNLQYRKVFYAKYVSPEALYNVGMKQMPLESAAKVLGTIERKLDGGDIESLYRIDHLVDKGSRIYAVLYKVRGFALIFE
uniref:F-box domain-containing protein n=1 Tax=Steinernema glaseri TaxID=37863 RepID=A0A1I7ZVH8_9BILA